jgi:hypothetical protein
MNRLPAKFAKAKQTKPIEKARIDAKRKAGGVV